MIIIMKLVSTLTYFIKNQQEILFRRQKKQLKNDTQPMFGKSTNDKSNNNQLRVNMPNMQMQINVKNNSFFGKRQAKDVHTQANKEIFSKQSQQFSHNRLANNEKIIKQTLKKNIQINHLYQIIKVTQLPMQLFNIHNKFCKQFTPGNYEHLFMKLHFSINNQGTILRYMHQKKNKMNEQSKAPIKQQNLQEKEIIFLSKQQMINHQEWKKLIQQIINKLQKINDIQTLNQYLRPILTIQRAYNFTPAQLYQYILAKNATANFEDLTTNNIGSIIHLLKYKNRIKQSSDKQSDEIENSEEETVSVNHFIAKIVEQIINNPQKYTKTQFIDVFIVVNRRKMRTNVLTEQLLTKSEKSIMAYLKDYTFHNIYTYIKIYAYFHPTPNIPLLNTLITSLSKKCNQKDNNNFLLIFLHNTKERKLIVQKYTGESISLQANSISTQIATVLSNRIDELKPIEVKYFLDYCFNNQIKDVNKSIYKQISLEISRKCKILSLQVLAKGLFKLHLLGCRQKMLANNVAQQFLRRYHQQMQSLNEDDGFQPPQTVNIKQKPLNLRQIHLQQCLIMVIWTLLKNHKENTVQSQQFKQLLKIIPTKVTSMDPLIIQLIENINYIRQKQQKIMYQFKPGMFPEGRLSQFYRQNFSKNEIQRLMWQEAQLTNQFIANYNIKSKRFLPERWSSVSTYKIKDYKQFCLQSSNYKLCFFDKDITLSQQFLQQRIEKINVYGKNTRNSSKSYQNHYNFREKNV